MADDFDPKAFLAETEPAKETPFDPKAFLAEGNPSPPSKGLGEKLMETWPAKAAQSIWSGVTAPGDVATGKFDVQPSGAADAHGNPTWTDEDEARRQLNDAAAISRAKELAAVATPASAAARAPLKVAAPAIDELRTAAKAGYESPTVKDVKIAGHAGPRLGQEIETNLNQTGIDENVAPKTFGIIGKLQKTPEPEIGQPDPFLTVDNLRNLRRTLGNVLQDYSPQANTDRLAARSAQQHIDEFLSGMAGPDLIAGDAKAAAQILKTANANYSAMKTASDMDVRMARAFARSSAANSGMNAGNVIRQRMADIIVNPKLARQFTPDELERITAIVHGTPVSNATRMASNVLGGGGGLGSAITGIFSHGMAPIAGYALRKAYNAMPMRAVKAINEAVRMRSPLGQERIAGNPQEVPSLTVPMRAGAISAKTGIGNLPMPQNLQAVGAQPNEDNVQGPSSQRKHGGRIGEKQNPAHGGNMGAFDPSSIGARKAKNNHWFIEDPKRPGRYLQVLPKKLGHARRLRSAAG